MGRAYKGGLLMNRNYPAVRQLRAGVNSPAAASFFIKKRKKREPENGSFDPRGGPEAPKKRKTGLRTAMRHNGLRHR